MNRKDIIRIAQETGVTAERVRDLVNFAALVASAEREACAKVCDERAQKKDLSNHRRCDADLLATAIRERGQA